MSKRKLIVTHHAPDMDAITSVWLLKRFSAQEFARAHVAFVNPGERISDEQVRELKVDLEDVVHVDTGMGKFDHHQPERARKHISAASLVYDFVCERYPDLSADRALHRIVEFATQIDHFGEISWPEADHYRYQLMIDKLIRGIEFTHPHDDESQLYFGMQCLDAGHAVLTQQAKAEEIINDKGREFATSKGACLALDTRNDETIKLAQMKGYVIVVRKDSKLGHVRIKARPDADVDLKPVYDRVLELDSQADWFYHHSGKMLINGSRKHRNQTASSLSLDEVVTIIQEAF